MSATMDAMCIICGIIVNRTNLSRHMLRNHNRQFNGIERTKKQILFKPKRYFDVSKEYENKLYCDSSADEPED